MEKLNKFLNYSKSFFWVFIDAVIVIAVVILLFSIFSGSPIKDKQTISVSAEGKVIVSPDLASISFSVLTQGADPEKVQTENSKLMNAAIDFVKSVGIDAKDIKTADYNLSPRYEPKPGIYNCYGLGDCNKIVGYNLTQTVYLKVRDFKKISTILAGLPEHGINQISQVNFQVENPDTYMKPARAEAFRKAKEKASDMANQAGVSLGKVVTFSDSSGGYAPRYYGLEKTMMANADSAPAPTIEPGSEEVTVYVSVTYEIK